jgi:hypothetical protein
MKPHDTPVPDDRPDGKQARKVYQKPELQVYGDLAEITKSLQGSNQTDNGTHNNKHYTS